MNVSIIEYLDRIIRDQDGLKAHDTDCASSDKSSTAAGLDFEERAAILEYEGGLARWQAEAQALQEINQRCNTAVKA